MNEPEDPGGSPPAVAHHVTISYDSSMDTDGSNSTSILRRKRNTPKTCRHCNKKRKRNNKNLDHGTDCSCESNVTESVPHNIPSSPSSHTVSDSNAAVTPNSDNVNRLYLPSDAAPFVVHISKIISSPNDNVSLHPVIFGRFLKHNSFQNIVNGSLKKIGRNRLSLAFNNHSDANNFIQNSILPANKYKALIPTFNITRMGIVRGIPIDLSPEQIIENVSVPIGCGRILKTRRLKVKKTIDGNTVFNDTETVVITFDGQILPTRIYMCYTALPVDLYIYPTIQCYNCCRYGHIKSQCRSKPRCFKCGQEHSGDSCTVDDDLIQCLHCSSISHTAISKSCPEHARQRSIKESMAKSSISYAESAKLHPPINRSYSSVVSSPSTLKKNLIDSSYNLPNQSSPLTSYKKTVFIKPKSPSNRVTKGYDRKSHESLIRDYNPPEPSNGCALDPEKNTQSIADIITLLIKLLSQFNNFTSSSSSSPSNVAPIFDILNSIINNHGQGGSLELPQRCQQKT